jgi:hypothetical protein
MRIRKKILLVFVFLTSVLMGSLCLAENSDSSRATLKGISVLVIVIEDLKPEIEREGLTTEMILSDTQDALQSGGVNVLDTGVPETAKKLGADWLKQGGPFLHIRPHILKIEDGRYAYNISAELCQSVLLERDGNLQVGGAATWSTHCFGIADGIKKIRRKISERVGIFILDYKAMNN